MGSASLSPAHLNITSCCNTVESRTSGIDLSCSMAKMTFVAILLLVACIVFHDASAQNMGNMWNMGMGRWNDGKHDGKQLQQLWNEKHGYEQLEWKNDGKYVG